MDNSFASILGPAQSVLVLLPAKPSFDQVAAGLALFLSLKQIKETNILCPSPMLVEFNRLVGVNKVASEVGNRNLIIQFGSYPAENVERVSADIESGKFFLTVVPKSGCSSPKKEEIQLNYSGVVADLVVLIGGENESDFPFLATADARGVNLIHLGIKDLSVSVDRKMMSFARPVSSLSEIVATLIKENNFNLDADIATNLVLGIDEGSNHFAGNDVVPETFELFAQLLRAGGRRQTAGVVEKQLVQPPAQAPADWLEPKIYKGTSVS